MSLLENQRNADEISNIYQELEEMLMANIINHCKNYKQPIQSDEWNMQKLAELGKLNSENIKIIAKQTGIAKSIIESMLFEMAGNVLGRLEPSFRALVRQGLTEDAVNIDKSKNIKKAMKVLYKQANDIINVCNTTMLYKARDAYTNLISNIVSTEKEYLKTLSKHATSVIIGTESRVQAVRKCIKEFNERGIPAFVDKRGREWTPEAYVNMSVRSTYGRVANDMQMARADDYQIDLVEVDSHSGARPKCAKDQGQIFDRANKSKKYRHWNTSSYGEPDGLLGINCRHHIYPYIEGVSIQRYFPVEKEENDKLYQATQKQRALERSVRKQKRECMLYDKIGDKEAFEDASVKLKSKEAQLRNYVSNNKGLHRRKDREQVVGFDKRISAKAIASKKYVDKYGSVKYNEDGTVKITDDWKNRGHVSIPKEYRKNTIIELTEKKGDNVQINRTFYNEDGKMYRQIHSGPHGNFKLHPYGKNGEHAHDYEWENGKITNRTTRNLTEKEKRK